jgi:endo-1,4-beta-mannosidase
MWMWRRFDAGEIREDFGRIAALGFDAVRFFLRWDDFQPGPDHVDEGMLARLETVVGLAGGAGLRAMPTLFCGHMSGVNWLPGWTLDAATPHGRFRTYVGDRESPRGIGDFYTGPLLDAQLRFADVVGRRLRSHPAVIAWDLGNEFSNLREPRSTHDAAAWSARLTEALEVASGIPVTAGTHGEDLTRDRRLRLSSLCAPFAFATMHGYSVYSDFARDRNDAEVVPYLARLAASFSAKPLLFSEFGNPTCPPGKVSPYERVAMPDEPPHEPVDPADPHRATYACLSEDEMAAYATRVLERLHADGRLGAYWWCWADYADELRETPPFDRAPHELSFGIVRSDGSEKPVARALCAFARERRTVVETHDSPMDEGSYYAELPRSTHAGYARFLETHVRG